MHRPHCQILPISFLSLILRLSIAGIAVAILPASRTTAGQEETSFDFSPLFSYAEDPENGEPQWLALGPLFEKTVYGKCEDKNVLLALPRPFYTHHTTDSGKRGGTDILWPFYFSRFSPQGSYQFLFPFIHTTKEAGRPDSKCQPCRYWLPPVFFTGRKTDGGRYYAIFPIGGSIYNLAGFDKVKFLLFPCYLQADKASVTSTSYLWPVFQTVKADNFSKWRVFPLYGTKKTPEYIQRYFLWPFFHILTPRSPDLAMGGFFFFPLAGYYKHVNDNIDTRLWTFLWPFFSNYQYGDDYKLHCPWPFLQFYKSTGENGISRKSYFWPFYGVTDNPRKTSRFIMWPVFRQSYIQKDDRQIKRFSVLTFSSRKKLKKEREISSSQHLWPLYKTENKGHKSRFWMPALWPNAEGDPITRNYAPFWRLFTCAGSENQTSAQAFWGLWQLTHEEDKKLETSLFPVFNLKSSTKGWAFSLLKGLLSGGVRNKQMTGRILWFFHW